MSEAIVRLQALGALTTGSAGWETVGRDRFAGVTPEGIQCSANGWGSDTCRFNLRRDPRGVYPDLGAFTPCEIEVAGQTVWSGRVWETPSKDGDDGGISVEGRGWQYHLDDDIYARLFVHTDLTAYKDSRSYTGTALTQLKQNGSVQAGDGGIIIAFASGVTTALNDGVAVTMDLGPDAKAKAVSMDFSMINAVTGWTVIVRLHDEVDVRNAVNFNDVITFTGAAPATSPTSGTSATGRRYVSVLFRADAAGTTSADRGIRITGMRVFANAAHMSSNASILKVSDIVADALSLAPLMSQSTSRISDTTFNVPEAYWFDNKTPREAITAFNAYHNNRVRIDVDGYLRFDAYPSIPIYEAGDWQGVDFEDASANSGESIYNRVIVEATGPNDTPLKVTRTQAGSSLITRRGFTRTAILPVEAKIITAAANKLGDTFLANHQTTPFRGGATVEFGGVRQIGNGSPVHPSVLLANTGELIRFTDRIDPDTGALGRDGRIVSVNYSHDSEQATVTIDNERRNFEALLARYGAIVGAGR